MKKYIIEIEENKAEIVASLLAQVSVKISKSPEEEKRRKIKLSSYSSSDGFEPSYLELTEEQYRLLIWLAKNDWLYEEACIEENPTLGFEKI